MDGFVASETILTDDHFIFGGEIGWVRNYYKDSQLALPC